MFVHRLPVESSAVASVGYDARTRTLELEFADGGGVYRYLAVPPRTYELLLRAESIGAFVNRRVKPYHRCLRVASRRRPTRPAALSQRRRRDAR